MPKLQLIAELIAGLPYDFPIDDPNTGVNASLRDLAKQALVDLDQEAAMDSRDA